MTQMTQVVTIQNNDIVQFEQDINRALIDLTDFFIIDIKYNTLYIGEQTIIHSALIIYSEP
ncbi:sporulation protein Cse60 [Lysinibacillus sp. FSL K6-0232]|uniref:sporulation protein Cse60 n=1 Tax=unclassified Lysinibacillus TaxID=2636778 RepID=UPI0030F4F2D7